MKSVKKLTACVMIILFALNLLYVNAFAQSNRFVDNSVLYGYTENEADNYSDMESSFMSVTNSTQPQSRSSVLEVQPPFIIVPLHSKPTIFSSVVSWLFVLTDVTVVGYEGYFTKVSVNSTGDIGYVFKFFLTSDSSLLVKQYENIYVGKTKSILKDYDNPEDFKWSVSQEGVISLNPQTGEITALKPGTLVVTAKHNGKTDECIVSSINPWKKTETATAEKNITVKSNPESSEYNNFNKGTIKKGAEIVAKGDIADGNGWIYVSSGNTWGFIELSDFSGIDYLMTEYHYYDQGYALRFNNINNKTASENIYDYASVLNAVMIANFKLKVCPYVYPYTSAADQCKIWRYSSVKLNNLASLCPKTVPHKTDACLQTGYLREELKNRFGNGGGTVSKVAWTGHVMNNYETDRSNATVGMGTIIITPYAVTNPNKNFSNYSNATIRKELLYTIVHETGHQFKLRDHYCKKDFSEETKKCSNVFCVTCNKLPYADYCIMLDRVNIETVDSNKIYCVYCKNAINTYLLDNF